MLKATAHRAMLAALLRRRSALVRLGRDQRGVSLVETMFAVAFLTFFLVVCAQLYYVSDLSSYTLTAAYRKGLVDVHEMDSQRKFNLRNEYSVTQTLPAMPGMEKWVEYFGLSDTPDSYSVTREVMISGGTYQGVGNSLYTLIDPFCPRHGGKRVLDVIKAFATQMDIGDLQFPAWEMLLDYIVHEVIWESVMHFLDYMLPPGTPDWVKEMIADEFTKYIEDALPQDQWQGGGEGGEGGGQLKQIGG